VHLVLCRLLNLVGIDACADFLLEPRNDQQFVVGADGEQDDDGEGLRHPMQFCANEILPHQHGKAE
jgi:hypothetical protein